MIAKNYIKHPEALRFQRELFSVGFHNSPRIMRLMECVFSWTPTVPQWWKDLKKAEARLIKFWKGNLMELFGKTEAVKAEPVISKVAQKRMDDDSKMKQQLAVKFGLPNLCANAYGVMQCNGFYRHFDRNTKRAPMVGLGNMGAYAYSDDE